MRTVLHITAPKISKAHRPFSSNSSSWRSPTVIACLLCQCCGCRWSSAFSCRILPWDSRSFCSSWTGFWSSSCSTNRIKTLGLHLSFCASSDYTSMGSGTPTNNTRFRINCLFLGGPAGRWSAELEGRSFSLQGCLKLLRMCWEWGYFEQGSV